MIGKEVIIGGRSRFYGQTGRVSKVYPKGFHGAGEVVEVVFDTPQGHLIKAQFPVEHAEDRERYMGAFIMF